MKIVLNNGEKRDRLNRLSEEEWMRWAYVPFVVAEGAWDYADSVINLSAQMRIPETKRLCRAVRELKRSYDYRRRSYAMTSSGHELDNFMVMEQCSAKSFRFMYDCIERSVRAKYPDLEKAHTDLLSGVYACISVIDVLYKYMQIQEAHVCEVCGFGTISSILPDEVHKLKKLMPEFAGDKPVKVRGIGLFTYNITRALCKVELTNDSTKQAI